MANQNLSRADTITDRVISSFEGCDSDRLTEIMKSLTRHLHEFAKEVSLTTQEWMAGIDFLMATGKISSDKRNEFILLSDLLGLSSLQVAINERVGDATESTVLGPFFVEGAREFSNGEDISDGANGEPTFVSIKVVDTSGAAIGDVTVDVWGSDADGFYDVQYDGDKLFNRGRFKSDEQGRVSFWSILPVAYPVPSDGPGGALLKATKRSNMRPAHLHFALTKEGYSQVVTHLFVAGDPFLGNDAVFGERESLICEFTKVAGDIGSSDPRRRDEHYEIEHVFKMAQI
ncbi:MAG: hydroxyquinol 1,2-dioxygenase [Actinomycetota bacterium]|nr:hydroxyquinol 1,2-dioxygenase [Actinomycetota bacterium]